MTCKCRLKRHQHETGTRHGNYYMLVKTSETENLVHLCAVAYIHTKSTHISKIKHLKQSAGGISIMRRVMYNFEQQSV